MSTTPLLLEHFGHDSSWHGVAEQHPDDVTFFMNPAFFSHFCLPLAFGHRNQMLWGKAGSV
jgi:hypothetical protein